MDVDSKSLICGVRPGILKSLLRKEIFDTPTAMRLFSLAEPTITETLIALAEDGWISFRGREDGIDRWIPAEKGMRLSATSLLKRIPLDEGRKILHRLINEARAINADKKGSRRVRSIRVFGSVLTGTASETVGDVDVVVDIHRRELPQPVLESMEQAEEASKPGGLNLLESLYWLDNRVQRRLKAVSRYLSFHPESDLGAKRAPFQEVYAYDTKAERERNPDLRVQTVRSAETTSSSVPLPPYPRRPARAWPRPPGKTVSVEISLEHALLAQHLWKNGIALEEIASRINSTSQRVKGYLSSRANRTDVAPARPGVSLKSMVLDVLPSGREYVVRVYASLPPRDELLIDVDIDSQRGRTLAKMRRVGQGYYILGAPPALLRTLEQVDAAAHAWCHYVGTRLRGLGTEVSAYCYPDTASGQSCTRAAIKLDGLTALLTDSLDRCWKHPRRPYDQRARRVAVTLSSEPILTFDEGSGRIKSRVVPARNAAPVIKAATALDHRFRKAIAGEHWTVYVRGDALVPND